MAICSVEMNTKDKEFLKRAVKRDVTHMFESVLHYVELICPDDRTYDVLRGKVLGAGNACIRKITKNIDENYNIKYISSSEDIIEVKQEL